MDTLAPRSLYFPASDVLTATVPVTATLDIGYGPFCDFEAEVVVYRDNADEVVVCEAFKILHDGKRAKMLPPVGAYPYTPTEHVHQSILDACRNPKVIRQMEEAMADAEEACEP